MPLVYQGLCQLLTWCHPWRGSSECPDQPESEWKGSSDLGMSNPPAEHCPSLSPGSLPPRPQLPLGLIEAGPTAGSREGTREGKALPEVPQPVERELDPGLGVGIGCKYFGVCVGRRGCQGLCIPGPRESPCVLWGGWSVFLHQMAHEPPRPGREVGEPAQRVGSAVWVSLCPPARGLGWVGHSATLWGREVGSVASP